MAICRDPLLADRPSMEASLPGDATAPSVSAGAAGPSLVGKMVLKGIWLVTGTFSVGGGVGRAGAITGGLVGSACLGGCDEGAAGCLGGGEGATGGLGG